MKIDATLFAATSPPSGPGPPTREAGYDGLYTAETQHDPFFPLLLAAQQTERMDLATAIAVAFPARPRTWPTSATTSSASRRSVYPRPRLADQGHIEKRFGAQFSQPAAACGS